jgi:uncharacterized ion transporter superfamily protein YfcC
MSKESIDEELNNFYLLSREIKMKNDELFVYIFKNLKRIVDKKSQKKRKKFKHLQKLILLLFLLIIVF